MEQLAANAERSSIKYKQVEYMGDHMGEVYSGVISGVTEWGLYVELDDNMCEGLVPVRELADDYYDFDEKNYCLIGRRNNVRYRLGDNVRVQVARASSSRSASSTLVLIDDRGRRPGEDTSATTSQPDRLPRTQRSARKTAQHNGVRHKRTATGAELPPRPITPDRHR